MINNPIIQKNFWKWCIATLDFAPENWELTLEILGGIFLVSLVWSYFILRQKWQQSLEGSYVFELHNDRSSMLKYSISIETTLRPSNRGKSSQGGGCMYLHRNGRKIRLTRICCTIDEKRSGNIRKEYDESDPDPDPDACDDRTLQFLEQFESQNIDLEHLYFNNDLTLSTKKGRWYCGRHYYGSINATKDMSRE